MFRPYTKFEELQKITKNIESLQEFLMYEIKSSAFLGRESYI